MFNAKNVLLQDRGDEFTYTGSGGKNLAGNKRIEQVLFIVGVYKNCLEFGLCINSWNIGL